MTFYQTFNAFLAMYQVSLPVLGFFVMRRGGARWLIGLRGMGIRSFRLRIGRLCFIVLVWTSSLLSRRLLDWCSSLGGFCSQTVGFPNLFSWMRLLTLPNGTLVIMLQMYIAVINEVSISTQHPFSLTDLHPPELRSGRRTEAKPPNPSLRRTHSPEVINRQLGRKVQSIPVHA